MFLAITTTLDASPFTFFPLVLVLTLPIDGAQNQYCRKQAVLLRFMGDR